MSDWTGNGNSIWKTLGASNHAEPEREPEDYYATSPEAIDKLLTVECPNNRIWECACGGGHLSERLKAKGFTVIGTDKTDRGYKSFTGQCDFLKVTKAPFTGSYDILTNPPYKYAKEFVLKALELLESGSKCYMVLKLTFLEGKARYKEIFRVAPPKTVYVFTERVQCAKNGDFEALKTGGGSAVAYAWFVWLKGYAGQTVIDWI